MYSARLKPAMFKMNIKFKKKNSNIKECCTYFNIQTTLLLQLTFSDCFSIRKLKIIYST